MICRIQFTIINFNQTKNGHNHFVDALKIILPDLPTRFAEVFDILFVYFYIILFPKII
jgi:hypothetical protein